MTFGVSLSWLYVMKSHKFVTFKLSQICDSGVGNKLFTTFYGSHIFLTFEVCPLSNL